LHVEKTERLNFLLDSGGGCENSQPECGASYRFIFVKLTRPTNGDNPFNY